MKNITTVEKLINPVMSLDSDEFQFADSWVPKPEDIMFRTVKGYIITNVSEFFKLRKPDNNLDAFCISTKRSYNNPAMREHTVKYLNYFEKFYDTDHLLYSTYCRIKYYIDCEPSYSKELFFYDIMKYIIRGPMEYMTAKMVTDNYTLNLTYKSRTSPSLQYSNRHAMLLMKISVQINQIIPLLCHFMYKKKIQNTTDFLFEIYDKVIDHPDIDIYSKLYETAYSNVMRSVKTNGPIWNKQD